MVVTVSPRAGAQPMAPAPPCTPDPCPTQIVRPACPAPNCHWYPDPANPAAFADRRPTAMVGMFNGSWLNNSRGHDPQWWAGAGSSCTDMARDEFSGYDMATFQFTLPGANGRPDQFDKLIANLEDLYLRGYRRIMLYIPAGVVNCQNVPASQWWPMAGWRRQWFATGTITTPYGPQLGVKGWIQQHPTVEMSVYMGWQIGDPCSICYQGNASAGSCPPGGTDCWPLAHWFPCHHEYSTHAPATTNAADLCTVWQNVQPWRQLGFGRFWMDAASVAASSGATEFREFAYNPNFTGSPTPVFGGEAFPFGPPLPNGRNPIALEEFDYAPWVILLGTAEAPWNNGNACPGACLPPCDPCLDSAPTTAGAHEWNLTTPAPPGGGVREGAIWPAYLPGCEGGGVHRDWDCGWERLKNTYEWYICKGFTYWQGDLLPTQSGIAERIFGFGQIKPGGDFDGDGQWTPADWQHWQDQYYPWLLAQAGLGSNMRLTYYHGDMDSSGVLDAADLVMAQDIIRDGLLGNDPHWLGDTDPQNLHAMNWWPNGPSAKWLPCPTGPSSSFWGPP